MVTNKNYYQHLKQVYKRTKDNHKPVNQLIRGAPKGKKFETVSYLRGRHTRKCPWRFDEIPYMQYIGYSGGYHQFLSCGEINYIIQCKEVKK